MRTIQYLLIGVTFLCLMCPVVLAHGRSYILSFDETAKKVPIDVWEEAKSTIGALGGKVTHEYSLIRGFSLELDDRVKEHVERVIQVMESKYGVKAHLEEDKLVHAAKEHFT